jgi:hypothetical protein
MIKIYLDNGYKKKISTTQFISWLRVGDLYIVDNKIYRDGEHIGYYVILTEDNFTILNCILFLVLLVLIILALMKGGVIL